MRVVRFVKTYRMYQPGERAGFAEAEAEALIAQGFAVDPIAAAQAAAAAAAEAEAEAAAAAAAAEAEAEAAAAAAAERKSMIADVIAELPEDAYTKSGAPEVDAINALLNDRLPDFAKHDPVTAAERDAVWAERQKQDA